MAVMYKNTLHEHAYVCFTVYNANLVCLLSRQRRRTGKLERMEVALSMTNGMFVVLIQMVTYDGMKVK